jgi:tetratricopeptide (TPR) repeat protein
MPGEDPAGDICYEHWRIQVKGEQIIAVTINNIEEKKLLRTIIHILLIISISFLAYSNTFNSPFQFDSKAVIAENPIIRNLQFYIDPSQAKVYKEFFEYKTFARRFIGYLSFALNYRFHQLDVTGYHVINLVIHIINALLIYLLVLLTLKTPRLLGSSMSGYRAHVAIVAALLFSSHPVQIQAITYVWQRVTSLATLFYLLSLISYVIWRLSAPGSNFKNRESFSVKTLLLYVTSIVASVLAMNTKQIAFTLPLIVLLYEGIFFTGRIRRRMLLLIPLLLTLLIIPVSLVDIDKPVGELIGDVSEVTRGASLMPRTEYFFTSIRVIVTYIRLIFLPVNQNLDYDYPQYGSFFNPEILISSLFLLSILGIAVYLLIKFRNTLLHTRLISFGILWFFINLSLESSIIPLSNVIYEHRLYLPIFGMLIAIITSLSIVIERLGQSWPGSGRTVVSVVGLIVIILTFATFQRNKVWKHENTMWEDVVSKSPNKPRGHNNLGLSYQSQGRIKEAIQHYETAVKLDPDYLLAYSNLGVAYKSLGYIDKAIEQYMRAVMIQPNDPITYYNLGNAYQSKGSFEEAIKYYRIAIRLKPDFTQAIANLNHVYELFQLR